MTMPSRVSTLAIISEVVLWSTILLVVWAGVHWGTQWYSRRFEGGQTILLQFRDASQLMAGSPVHFMGTDIGYVTSVKPHEGRIQVELKTDRHAVKIPEGSHFTIQFNSLAGAKTLEVLPPRTKSDFSADHYIVEEPMRLGDVMKTQMILAEALESSSNNLAQSLGQVQDERVLMEKLHTVNDRLTSYENALERTVANMQGYLVRLHQFKTNSLGYIQNIIVGFHRLDRLTRPAYFKSSAAETVRYLALGMENTYRIFVKARDEKALQGFEQRLIRLDDQLIDWRGQAESTLPRIIQGWACFNSSLCRIDSALGGWQTSMEKNPLPPRIQRAKQTMHDLNGKVRDFVTPPPKSATP